MAPLVIEFLLLFFVAPASFFLARPRFSPIPVLWVVMVYCLAKLLRDPKFDRSRLWDSSGLWLHAPAILMLFAGITAIGVALVLRYAPMSFLSLPRSNPRLWGLIMVLYPILSVYPQSVDVVEKGFDCSGSTSRRVGCFQRDGSLVHPSIIG